MATSRFPAVHLPVVTIRRQSPAAAPAAPGSSKDRRPPVPVLLNSDDLYQRLGIESTASHDEVRRAYRALLRQYPPERAPEEFKRIREAYETLNDPESREAYDRAPSPEVQEYTRLAHAAMEGRDYAAAIGYVKRIIIAAPELDFARNLLGLCYLYQRDAEQAVATYERLLVKPQPAPCWIGNAGHAARLAGRAAEAEQLFIRAIALGSAAGDDVSSYHLALADLYLEKREFAWAERTLEQAIGEDGVVDFADLPYFTKLVEVQLCRHDLAGLARVLDRLKGVCTQEDEREYAAWKLGALGFDLVAAGAFSAATLVAATARGLQPADGDYRALSEAASYLDAYRLDSVLRLVQTHPSFREGGWLVQLGPRIREHCDQMKPLVGMTPVTSAPSLFTLNGVGTMLYGNRDYDRHTRSHVAVLYFVILFLPVFPLAAYRVIPAGDRSWKFVGKMPLGAGAVLHRKIAGGLAALMFLALVVAGLAGDGSSGDSGSYSTSYPTSSAGTAQQASNAYLPAGTPGGGGSESGGGGPASFERSRLDAERAELQRTERELQRLETEIEGNNASIAELAEQIRRSRAAPTRDGAAADYERYSGLVRQHNQLVDQTDALIDRHNRMLGSLRGRVDAFNARVDALNHR